MMISEDIGSVLPGLLELSCGDLPAGEEAFAGESDFWAFLRARVTVRSLVSEMSARSRAALTWLARVDAGPQLWSGEGYSDRRINPGAPLPAAVARVRRVAQALQAKLADWDELFVVRIRRTLDQEIQPNLLRLMKAEGLSRSDVDIVAFLVFVDRVPGFPLPGASWSLGAAGPSIRSLSLWLSLDTGEVGRLVHGTHRVVASGVCDLVGETAGLDQCLVVRRLDEMGFHVSDASDTDPHTGQSSAVELEGTAP